MSLLDEMRTLLTKEIDGHTFELRSSKDETTQRVIDAIWPLLDSIPEEKVEEEVVVEEAPKAATKAFKF